MKQSYLFFTFFLTSLTAIAFAQNSQRNLNFSMDSSLVWDLGMGYSNVDGRPAGLFQGQLRAFAMEKLSVGLQFALFQRNTSNDFGREVIEPQLRYGEAGLIASYNLVQSKRFWISPMLTMGYAAAVMSDRAIKESQTVIYGNGDFFYADQQEVPKEIVRNNYFLVKPELMATVRFSRYLGFELGGGYNLLAGNSRFGNKSDFSNWVARAGIVFIIPGNEMTNE